MSNPCCSFCGKEIKNPFPERKLRHDAKFCSSTCWHREYRESDEGWAKDSIRKAKKRANVVDKGFDITWQFLLKLLKEQDRRCAITGIEFKFRSEFEGRMDQYRASVDRVDSTKGYTKDNVQLVCAQVNIMKHQSTEKELLFWATKIAEGLI
jgi:hypothetical protein